MNTTRLREVLDDRDAIDAEIAAEINGTALKPARAPQKCSKCGSPSHNARNCDKQQELHVV